MGSLGKIVSWIIITDENISQIGGVNYGFRINKSEAC